MILEALGVFAVVFAADVFWAKYIELIALNSKFKASIYSMFVYLFGAFAITEYVSNKWMIIPAMLGAFTGTYFGMGRK